MGNMQGVLPCLPACFEDVPGTETCAPRHVLDDTILSPPRDDPWEQRRKNLQKQRLHCYKNSGCTMVGHEAPRALKQDGPILETTSPFCASPVGALQAAANLGPEQQREKQVVCQIFGRLLPQHTLHTILHHSMQRLLHSCSLLNHVSHISHVSVALLATHHGGSVNTLGAGGGGERADNTSPSSTTALRAFSYCEFPTPSLNVGSVGNCEFPTCLHIKRRRGIRRRDVLKMK